MNKQFERRLFFLGGGGIIQFRVVSEGTRTSKNFFFYYIRKLGFGIEKLDEFASYGLNRVVFSR